jgi:hypothetical protein
LENPKIDFNEHFKALSWSKDKEKKVEIVIPEDMWDTEIGKKANTVIYLYNKKIRIKWR